MGIPASLRAVTPTAEPGRWQTGWVRATSNGISWQRSFRRRSPPIDFTDARETGSRQVHGAEVWWVNRHCIVLQLLSRGGKHELAVLPGDLAATRTVLRL